MIGISKVKYLQMANVTVNVPLTYLVDVTDEQPEAVTRTAVAEHSLELVD